MTRTRQAALLAQPSLRAVPWLPILLAGLLSLAIVSLDAEPLLELRLSALALALGAAFGIDDDAAETLAASPARLLFRRLVRLPFALGLIAGLWAVTVWRSGSGAWLPVTLELAALAGAGLAVAAVAGARLGDGRGGVAAAPALLALVAAAAVALPDSWTLYAHGPSDPRWADSHERWAALLTASAAAFVLASRDPARRRSVPRLRPRPGAIETEPT